jgi:hypothetical protein
MWLPSALYSNEKISEETFIYKPWKADLYQTLKSKKT